MRILPILLVAFLTTSGGAGAAEPAQGEKADNTACYVCHPGLKQELITTTHLAKGYGCVKCHGASTEHLQDEMQMTTPDVLYGRRQVDAMCTECHQFPHEDVEQEVKDFLAEWRGRSRPNGRTIYENSICTDCHGTHNIDTERDKADEQEASKWLSAFNGTDLTGWRPVGSAEWKVRLGRIVGTPGADRPGDLLSEAEYGDYRMAVTFRADMPLHAGLWLRANGESLGPRVEIFEHENPRAFTGSVNVPGTGLVLRNVHDDLFDPGGWNTLSVEARGLRVTVWLNGEQIGAVRCLPPGKGRIGLHLQGGTPAAGSQLAVREVQVRELPAEDSENEDTQRKSAGAP